VTEGQIDYRLQCPVGYIPIGYSMRPQFPYDLNTEFKRDLIDVNRNTINRGSLSATAPLDGAGYAVTDVNEEHHQHEGEFIATCLAIGGVADNALVLVSNSVSVAKRATGTATTFCPAESPVALGGFSNAGGYRLQDLGSAPVWGTSANPVTLASMDDGET